MAVWLSPAAPVTSAASNHGRRSRCHFLTGGAGAINKANKIDQMLAEGSQVSTFGKNTQTTADVLQPSLKTSTIPGATHLDIKNAIQNPLRDVRPVHADQASSLGSTKSSDEAIKGSTDPCLLRRYRRKRSVPPCNRVPGAADPYHSVNSPQNADQPINSPPNPDHPVNYPQNPDHPVNYPHSPDHAKLQETPNKKPNFRSRVSAYVRTPPTVLIKNSAKKVGKHSVGLAKSAVGLTAATFYLAAKPFVIGGAMVGYAIGKTAKAIIVVTGKGLRLFYKGAKTAGSATAKGVVKTSKFGVKVAKAGVNAVKTVGLATVMGVLGGFRLVGKGVIGFMKLLARMGKLTLRGTGHVLAKTGEGIGKAGHKLTKIQRLRLA
ncbi:hypothetical protein DFH28DRAFT_241202 [Melampsora americana]|nr:hypothetical protein DFH28DRAFT_241202 [Melampsora americana]